MKSLDKFRGCLVGGAVGDALGYAVEFSSEEEIFSRYGAQGIAEYELKDGTACISDDTQMTLFTANGLLYGTTRQMMRGIRGAYPEYISRCYKDWLRTQIEGFPLEGNDHISWLVDVPELFSPREPGRTCIQAIMQGANGTPEHPLNNSKGCGGVMRVAPVGLYFADKKCSLEKVARLGAEVAALTHGHELGYISSAMLAHIICGIIRTPGERLLRHIQNAKTSIAVLFPVAQHMKTLLSLVDQAVLLAGSEIDDLDAIHALGEGWVAEETLAIAIYCALKYETNFEKAIVASVNHKGDSDSTGAVTGNILGAYMGLGAIPEKYLRSLELKHVILEMADDLYHDCQVSEYDVDLDRTWIRKYVNGCRDADKVGRLN